MAELNREAVGYAMKAMFDITDPSVPLYAEEFADHYEDYERNSWLTTQE